MIQIKAGVKSQDVACNKDLILVIKNSDISPAYVKPSSVSKLEDLSVASLSFHTQKRVRK
jgi:hypothetical protein